MKPIVASEYHDLVQLETPRVAPAGNRVAVVRKVPSGPREYESTIHTVSTSGDGSLTRFTPVDGTDSTPRWHPSSASLAFVSDRGEDGRTDVWLTSGPGDDPDRLTAVVGDVDAPAWSPDGERLAFTQRSTLGEREAGHDISVCDDYERAEPDPRVIDDPVYRERGEYVHELDSHAYVVDTADGSVTRLTEGKRDVTTLTWTDERTLHALVERDPDTEGTLNYDILAIDTETETTEHVTTVTDWGSVLVAAADGRLAYTQTPGERPTLRKTDIEVLDPDTGERTTPTADFDRTQTFDRHVHWDAGDLYFTAPDRRNVCLYRVTDGAVEPVIADGHVLDFHAAGDVAVGVRATWEHRGDLYAVHDDGKLERLTAVNDDYCASHHVSRPEPISFQSGDTTVDGWVLTPPDFDATESYPLAVEIHGGPHISWTASGSMWHEFQTLAAEGYVVFWCNPRGSIGYGQSFAASVDRAWGPVAGADVLAGVETVTDRDYVDEENVFVTGGSFGGYLTAWLVGQSDSFRGAVVQRGIYDLPSFYGSTDIPSLVEWEFDATPWENPDFLWEQSPVAHAESISTPTLVLHAENDYRTPIGNAEMFYQFLKQNDVDTRFVRYPRESHELSRSGEPAHVVDRLERIVGWFDGYSDHHDAEPPVE